MRTLCLVLAAILLAAHGGLAQNSKKKTEQTRTVQGTVTAPNDSMINGAVVQLKNLKSLQIRSFITQKDGSYHFNELSPDIDYELHATYSGMSTSTKTLSSFDSRKEAIINLKLNPKK
jgi:two-component SAPR family response regulator